jgi:hypothetical protein
VFVWNRKSGVDPTGAGVLGLIGRCIGNSDRRSEKTEGFEKWRYDRRPKSGARGNDGCGVVDSAGAL